MSMLKLLSRRGAMLLLLAATAGGFPLSPGCGLLRGNPPAADRAEASLRSGDYEGAIRLLTEALKTDPEDSDLCALLGRSFYLLAENLAANPDAGGDPTSAFSDAERFFDRALSSDPENREAALGLARARYKMNDLAGAREAVEGVLERAPEDVQALVLSARIALASGAEGGGSAEAVPRLEKALALDPKQGEAYLLLGDAHLNAGDGPAAVEAYQRGIRACPDENRLHERLLSLREQAYGLAPEQGIAVYEELLRGNRDYTGRERARLWWFLGSWYGTAGMAAYGKQEYQEAAAAFGRHLDCLEACGRTFPSFGPDAEDAAVQVRVNRAWCFIKTGEFEAAEKDLFAALAPDPERKSTVFAVDSLGYAISREKGFASARDFYRRLTARFGGRHQWWNDFGYFSLETNMRSKAPPEAYRETLEIYHRALELKPDYPRYLNDYATVIFYYLDPEGKRHPEVEALYKKAWKLGREAYESPFTDGVEKSTMFSAFTDALVNLTELYLREGRLDEARTMLKELEGAAPDRPETGPLRRRLEQAASKTQGRSGGRL